VDSLTERPSILDLDLPGLEQVMAGWNQPAYRAHQVWRAIYRRGINSADLATDLPSDVRRRLDEAFEFRGFLEVARRRSGDGHTTKWLLADRTGRAKVEAVLMTYDRRRTACISTQAGCAMGCSFCATGQMGFGRNLTAGEIVEQALRLGGDRRLTNIVLMGMGEPFHNYQASLAAVDRLIDPHGMRFGARRITISTVGIVPMIRRFAEERRQVNLAVSLHAATDELRDRLVPVNRRYPLSSLMEVCREYIGATHRRLTFEWALIRDVNDGPDQAQALAERLRGMLCHVNLIPLNPTAGFAGAAPDSRRAESFRARLKSSGIPCTLRVRRGIDIQAGCGQLATEGVADLGPRGRENH
jgi:23S rRNA (adenine2503-C2)-methyltransferase